MGVTVRKKCQQKKSPLRVQLLGVWKEDIMGSGLVSVYCESRLTILLMVV